MHLHMQQAQCLPASPSDRACVRPPVCWSVGRSVGSPVRLSVRLLSARPPTCPSSRPRAHARVRSFVPLSLPVSLHQSIRGTHDLRTLWPRADTHVMDWQTMHSIAAARGSDIADPAGVAVRCFACEAARLAREEDAIEAPDRSKN